MKSILERIREDVGEITYNRWKIQAERHYSEKPQGSREDFVYSEINRRYETLKSLEVKKESTE